MTTPTTTPTPVPTPTPEVIVLDWQITWWEQAEMDRWAPDGTPVAKEVK